MPAQERELEGLVSKGDPYSAVAFSPTHVAFKAAHNEAFAALARHCGGLDAPVFYLDGAQGGTTATLLERGFQAEQLVVANYFATTCATLSRAFAGVTVVEARADAALLAAPAVDIPFAAVYLDGCGGSPGPLVAAVDAFFDERRAALAPRFAIGFTLTEAEPLGRELAHREREMHRAVATGCRRRGFRLAHAGDEPERYGLDPTAPKKEGCTLTSWLVCERK
jgi:hypothetical protein